MGITNFNKIINISLIRTSASGDRDELAIKCPTTGRKPNIEVVGSFTTDSCIPQFDITIKNYYIDSSSYDSVHVELGYESSVKTAFEGQIIYMYQSAPGPEGSTVIHCIQGNYDSWLKANINVSVDKGYSLSLMINQINKALGYTNEPKMSSNLSDKSLSNKIDHNGSVRELVTQLRNRENIIIKDINKTLIVYEVGKSHGLNTHRLPILSSPPLIQGGEEGNSYVEVTAPYNPEIKPGDKVSFTSTFYKTSLNLGKVGEETTIAVANVQFHFGTVSNVNQMVLSGNPIQG